MQEAQIASNNNVKNLQHCLWGINKLKHEILWHDILKHEALWHHHLSELDFQNTDSLIFAKVKLWTWH